MSNTTGSQAAGPISQVGERLRREFDRWLETALQQGGRALDAVGLRGTDRTWTPSVDVVETPTEIQVDVELPGVEPAVVDVSLAGNMLTVQGPKKLWSLPQGAVSHLVERMHGPFERSIPMPAPVLADSVTADLKHGILRVRLLKSEKARSLKIPVQGEPALPRTVSPTPSI